MRSYKTLALLGLITMMAAFSQESTLEVKVKAVDYKISDEYRNGENLIYDCKKETFLCVSLDGYLGCEEKRKKALIEKISEDLPCAPLKKFESATICHKAQLKEVEKNPVIKFCQVKN